jgi:hypothetical protein
MHMTVLLVELAVHIAQLGRLNVYAQVNALTGVQCQAVAVLS